MLSRTLSRGEPHRRDFLCAVGGIASAGASVFSRAKRSRQDLGWGVFHDR